MDKTSRNSSIELLRILAMVFIVISHSSVHGGLPDVASDIMFNNLLLDWCVLGNLGVDIFIIISGYFMCTNKNMSQTNRIVKLCTQVWFYSILCLAIYAVLGYSINVKTIIEALFPTIFSVYWFFTTYVVLILLSPYLNIVLDKLTHKQFLTFMGLILLIWCVIPTFTRSSMGSNELCQFIMFYIIGAYFKKYKNPLTNKKIRYCLTGVSFLLLFSSSIVIRIVLGEQFALLFYDRNSVLVVGCAVGLFSIALYHREFYNKNINRIAGCVFGVYLFHDNPLIRSILWTEWLPKTEFYNSNLLILSITFSVVIIMSAGTLLEWLRQKTVDKYFLRAVHGIIQKVCTKIHTDD